MEHQINSSQVPIYRESGFSLSDIESTVNAFLSEKENQRQPKQYIYSRYRNPTVVAVEEQIMQLENSKWALLMQSGMAAIDTAVSIFQKGKDTGTWLFFSEIYGGTNSYIDLVLKKLRGVNIERFYAENGIYDLHKLDLLIDSLKPQFVYFEAVSNPMLIVADALEIIRICKKHAVRILIDNTFATPFLWKPLEDGADLVIHSVTKYFSGHGNLTGGVLCGNDNDLEKQAIEYRKWVGHMMCPDDASRLGSFLKTFEIRMRQHCNNAFKLAKKLAKHPKVESVLYPGLSDHSTHQNALKLFKDKGFGGMITFDLKSSTDNDKRKAADNFIGAISNHIKLIPTLGDADTILLPVQAVWGDKYPLPGMIRLSVGLENYVHLEQVILEGLDKI